MVPAGRRASEASPAWRPVLHLRTGPTGHPPVWPSWLLQGERARGRGSCHTAGQVRGGPKGDGVWKPTHRLLQPVWTGDGSQDQVPHEYGKCSAPPPGNPSSEQKKLGTNTRTRTPAWGEGAGTRSLGGWAGPQTLGSRRGSPARPPPDPRPRVRGDGGGLGECIRALGVYPGRPPENRAPCSHRAGWARRKGF